MATGTTGLTPWLTIWLRPRATIRQIVGTDPGHRVILLAALSGLFRALDGVSRGNLGDFWPLWVILVLCAVIGPLAGIIGLYLSGIILRWTGGLLGGQATEAEVRAAVAWSSVPGIAAGVILWIPMLALYGGEAFASAAPRTDALFEGSPVLALLGGLILMGALVVARVMGFWGLIVFLKCLGEVHRCSVWEALVAAVIPFVVVLVPVLCLALAAR